MMEKDLNSKDCVNCRFAKQVEWPASKMCLLRCAHVDSLNDQGVATPTMMMRAPRGACGVEAALFEPLAECVADAFKGGDNAGSNDTGLEVGSATADESGDKLGMFSRIPLTELLVDVPNSVLHVVGSGHASLAHEFFKADGVHESVLDVLMSEGLIESQNVTSVQQFDGHLMIIFKSKAAAEQFASRWDRSVTAVSVLDELKGPVSNEGWELDYLRSGRIVLRRKAGGRVVESYRPMTRDEALVAITAVLTGFQPPRFLDRLDTPADQTQSEQSADCAALRGNSPDRRSQ